LVISNSLNGVEVKNEHKNFFFLAIYKLADFDFDKLIFLQNKNGTLDNSYVGNMGHSRERKIAGKSKRFRKKYGAASKTAKIRDKEYQDTKIQNILQRLEILKELLKLADLKQIETLLTDLCTAERDTDTIENLSQKGQNSPEKETLGNPQKKSLSIAAISAYNPKKPAGNNQRNIFSFFYQAILLNDQNIIYEV
jgi:hypothetical protein